MSISARVDLHLMLIRSELFHVEVTTSHVAAASVGEHLQEIARTLSPPPPAIEAVREASLVLLLDLVRSGDVEASRRAALRSLKELEASLAA